jgi:uncharacterized protein (TIGR03083 family)
MDSPIQCAHLIREVDVRLIQLLAQLEPHEWDLQTVAPRWKVRDVAAHLLDTALRKLSLARDGCFVEPATIRSAADLAELVDRLNAEGVRVYRRLSPAVLISLMSESCSQSADFHESLDPFAQAAFPVSWAGEERSLNWFDTARELTERWHHQQQIRHATGRPGIMIPELYHPVLDCFLRGLPYTLRDASGSAVRVEISGDCGGVWQVAKDSHGWSFTEPSGQWDACVTVPQEIAWLLFTKGQDVQSKVEIRGNRTLGLQALALTAIVG